MLRFFFFSSRRRHTRFDCDWSSDVCFPISQVEIKRYVVVHDCGRVINPMIVEGQIHGGVAHGIGNAFYEQLVYDEEGQLLNASFMDRSEEHTSELQSQSNLVCRLLLEKKKK